MEERCGRWWGIRDDGGTLRGMGDIAEACRGWGRWWEIKDDGGGWRGIARDG